MAGTSESPEGTIGTTSKLVQKELLEQVVKDGAKGYMDNLVYHFPTKLVNSREFSLVKTNLEQAELWALRCIERNK